MAFRSNCIQDTLNTFLFSKTITAYQVPTIYMLGPELYKHRLHQSFSPENQLATSSVADREVRCPSPTALQAAGACQGRPAGHTRPPVLVRPSPGEQPWSSGSEAFPPCAARKGEFPRPGDSRNGRASDPRCSSAGWVARLRGAPATRRAQPGCCPRCVVPSSRLSAADPSTTPIPYTRKWGRQAREPAGTAGSGWGAQGRAQATATRRGADLRGQATPELPHRQAPSRPLPPRETVSPLCSDLSSHVRLHSHLHINLRLIN